MFEMFLIPRGFPISIYMLHGEEKVKYFLSSTKYVFSIGIILEDLWKCVSSILVPVFLGSAKHVIFYNDTSVLGPRCLLTHGTSR